MYLWFPVKDEGCQDPCHTQEPDYSDVPEEEYDWAKSVYGDVSKLIPKDAPKPPGKYMMLSL